MGALPKKGFTLIELILYVSMTGVFLFTLSLFLATLLSGRVKHQVITEVEGAGNHITYILGTVIRNADSITSPIQGQNSTILTLDASGTLHDPTVFSITNQLLRITEGAEAAVDLHGSHVLVSDILFKNLSRDSTPGIITFQFTLSHAHNGTNEFNYSKTFYGSAALR